MSPRGGYSPTSFITNFGSTTGVTYFVGGVISSIFMPFSFWSTSACT